MILNHVYDSILIHVNVPAVCFFQCECWPAFETTWVTWLLHESFPWSHWKFACIPIFNWVTEPFFFFWSCSVGRLRQQQQDAFKYTFILKALNMIHAPGSEQSRNWMKLMPIWDATDYPVPAFAAQQHQLGVMQWFW